MDKIRNSFSPNSGSVTPGDPTTARPARSGKAQSVTPSSMLAPLSKQIARTAYESTRLFHGTTNKHATNIRANGFRLDEKPSNQERQRIPAGQRAVSSTRGWMEALNESARTHHFLTGKKDTAEFYATLGSKTHPGKVLIRTIGLPSEDIPFEADPFDDRALRTSKDIPKEHVLGRKTDPSGDDARIFQNELHKNGLNVDLQTAGQLLREVQSDDEEDF
ncbi:hypothetical protein [Paraburkholderia humisilvae]|uniref:hypothetical protein n=1 Tax=Paraburkholderia humisilvae TaxID=627669 RepID=UPI001582C3D5